MLTLDRPVTVTVFTVSLKQWPVSVSIRGGFPSWVARQTENLVFDPTRAQPVYVLCLCAPRVSRLNHRKFSYKKSFRKLARRKVSLPGGLGFEGSRLLTRPPLRPTSRGMPHQSNGMSLSIPVSISVSRPNNDSSTLALMPSSSLTTTSRPVNAPSTTSTTSPTANS